VNEKKVSVESGGTLQTWKKSRSGRMGISWNDSESLGESDINEKMENTSGSVKITKLTFSDKAERYLSKSSRGERGEQRLALMFPRAG
jgi:hypothetical protein